MLNLLFWFALAITLGMTWRSRKLWTAYNEAHVTRTAVVQQIFMTLVAAGVTIALLAAGRLIG